MAEKRVVERAEKMIVVVLCRCRVRCAEWAGEQSLASCGCLGALLGIMSYRSVALMKETFIVAPCPW